MIVNLILAGMLILNSAAPAQDSSIIEVPGPGILQKPPGYVPHIYPERPHLALALSGGGARGFAHIGVLEALEESGIPIDGIAGTSIGAIVGGLYASGYSIADLEEMTRSFEWSEILQNAPTRKSLPLSRKGSESTSILEVHFEGTRPYIPSALSAGQRLSSLLVDRINRAPYRGEPDFDYLKVKFAAVSVDVRNGERILFRSGDLAEALFASMAVPLLVAPVRYDHHLLIDGGVAENIPVRAAGELGDYVIAVDVTMPPVLGSPPYEPWIIANQVTGLMQQNRNRQLLAEADLVITAVPDTLSSFSFDDPAALIEMGYKAAKSAIPKIKAELARRKADTEDPPIKVNQVELDSSLFTQEFRANSLTFQSIKAGLIPRRGDIIRDLEWLQSDGRVKETKARISGDTLIFLVDENPRLNSIELIGVSQLPMKVLLDTLNQDTGKVIDARSSAARLEWILRYYRKIGNPLARIAGITVSENGHLKIEIDEGTVKNVRTQGEHYVGSGRILRDLDVKVGKPLNISKIIRGIEELYGSDLFNLVRATCEDGVVTIKVSERPPPRIRLGAGVDSERHGRGLLELSYESIPTVGGGLSAWLKYGEFDERYSLTYRNLAVFQTYLEGSGSADWARTEYHYYDPAGGSHGLYHFDRIGGSAYIGQQFRTWGRIVLGIRGERIRTDHRDSPPELDLRRVFLRSEIDTQDQAEFPSSGRRYEIQLESAAPALGGDVSFNRAQIQLKNIFPISRRLTFLSRLTGSICDQATPFSDWFRLGGEGSFLGLHEAELAGRRMMSLNLEIREDLISRFLAEAYLSVRGDIGAIWENTEADVSSQDFQQGIGISFDLDTLLGPISISYGRLFANSPLQDRDLIYFNLGHRF